jgi:hypothetical protein
MAFDGDRGRIVLLGGTSNGLASGLLADTWELPWCAAPVADPGPSLLTTASLADPFAWATSFAPDVAGTYRVSVRVVDSFQATSSATVTVDAVLAVLTDPPPVVLAVPEQPTNGSLVAAVRTPGTTVAIQQLDCKLVFDAAHLEFSDYDANAQIPFSYTGNVLTTLMGVLFQSKNTDGSPLPAGPLVGLTFSARTDKLPFDAVTLLSVTAKSKRTPAGVTLYRPSADAGIRQSVVTQRVNGTPAWPSSLEPPSANLRPFIQLDGRTSRDPNPVRHSLTYQWTVLPGGPELTLVNPTSPTPSFVPTSPTTGTTGSFDTFGGGDQPRGRGDWLCGHLHAGRQPRRAGRYETAAPRPRGTHLVLPG